MDNTQNRSFPPPPAPSLTHLSVYKVACQILERFECERVRGHADCIAYAAELKEKRDLRSLHDDGHAAKAAAAAAADAAAAANAAVAAADAAAVMCVSLGHDGALICPGNGSCLACPAAGSQGAVGGVVWAGGGQRQFLNINCALLLACGRRKCQGRNNFALLFSFAFTILIVIALLCCFFFCFFYFFPLDV